MKYFANYYRYYIKKSEEFETAKEAAQFLYDGEMDGSLSWDRVTDEDGNVLASHDKIGDNYKNLRELGATNEED